MRIGSAGRPGKERSRNTTHVIYDTRSGHIVETHHFVGDASSSEPDRIAHLLKEAHEKSHLPLDHLAILTDPDFPQGDGEMKVNHAAKRLVRSGAAPPQRIRP
jgi:hypothetical protein